MDVQELMGRLIGYVILAVGSFLLSYFGIAFAEWTLNPSLWGMSARGFVVLATVALVVVYLIANQDRPDTSTPVVREPVYRGQ